MLCLADYFAVISTKIDSTDKTARPAVSLRVPSEEVPDNPFPEGIEHFALPNGWNIEAKWRQPLFHTTRLTKLDGSPYYAAFFTYYAKSESDQYQFEPISLILIARHIHSRQLKNALILLYHKHILGNSTIFFGKFFDFQALKHIGCKVCHFVCFFFPSKLRQKIIFLLDGIHCNNYKKCN